MFLPQVTDVLYHQYLIDKINTRNSARVKDVFNSKTEDMSYSKFCNKNNFSGCVTDVFQWLTENTERWFSVDEMGSRDVWHWIFFHYILLVRNREDVFANVCGISSWIFLCVILTFTCLWCVFYLFANYRSTIVSAKCDCWIKTRTLIYALWMLQVTMGAPRVAKRKIFIEWRNSKYKGANTAMTDLKGPIPEKIIYQLFWSYWFSVLALNWLLDDISHKNQNLVICSGRLIEV